MLLFIFLCFVIGLFASHGVATNGTLNSLGQPSSKIESPGFVESKRSDDIKRYVVWPKDGRNETALAKTDDHLKSVTGLPKVFSYRMYDNRLLLWLVNVTNTQVAEIEKDDGVLSVKEDVDDKKDANVIPVPSPAAQISDLVPKLGKREIKYSTQIGAVSRSSSNHTVPTLSDLENYVYESHAGAGIFIYHIESGISAGKIQEFPEAQVEFLLTPLAQQTSLNPRTDDSVTFSHSTCTASKTIGQTYGSTKKATLVVVKMGATTSNEFVMAFNLVFEDIAAKNRKKKSIVSYSRVDTTVADPNNLSTPQIEERDILKQFFENDIIVVMAAGNEGDIKDDKGNLRVNIDNVPQIFSSDQYPLIIVGAADLSGTPAPWSQGGNALTIYGPGVGVRCQNKQFNSPLVRSGTSYAAPSIAGVLAIFLAYDQIPFDTSDGNVAANARKYLQDSANWQRKEGVKYIWNGVTEANNPKKVPAPLSTSLASSIAPPMPTPAPDKNQCHGVSGNVWIDSRDTAVQNAAAFCTQSSKSIEYNQGTGSDLRLTVNYQADGSKTPDCHNRFVNIIIDGCDGDHPVNNPYNYKYGSTLTTYDGWTFEMQALATHIDDDNCDVSYKVLYDFFEVRGRNFPTAKLGVDGAGLLQQLKGCGDITDWYFEMTPHDVKYQWYASGKTIIGEKSCIGRAVESAGGTDTGNCNGSG